MGDSIGFRNFPGYRAPEPHYTIEGALVTTLDIADRIGATRAAAATRLRKAQRLDGPVTWAKLGVTHG